MIDVDLAFPLAAGLIAAFNPCGFAMLPAYLSFFLGQDQENETDGYQNLLTGLKVSLTLSSGFIFVFAILGVLTNSIISESFIERRAGYLTLAIGIILILLGLAMIRGLQPTLKIPGFRITNINRQLPSIFLFGVSYAVVSVGCSAPIFFITVGSSFSRDGVIDGLAVFITYALGMSIVVTLLTLSLAMARTMIAKNMRRLLPYLSLISGILLTGAGFFLTAYGWWEIQLSRGKPSTNTFVDLSLRGSGRLSTWVDNVGSGRFAMACLMIVILSLMWVLTSQFTVGMRRSLIRGVSGLLFMAIDIFAYDFDLLIVPTVRTIGGFPERFLNWFTDPLRWASFWEVGVLSLLIVQIYSSIRSRNRVISKTEDPKEVTF